MKKSRILLIIMSLLLALPGCSRAARSVDLTLSGKKIALFGSYGWGDGEWMRNWNDRCVEDGAVMACDFVICNDAPDDEAVEACKTLGAALV